MMLNVCVKFRENRTRSFRKITTSLTKRGGTIFQQGSRSKIEFYHVPW